MRFFLQYYIIVTAVVSREEKNLAERQAVFGQILLYIGGGQPERFDAVAVELAV